MLCRREPTKFHSEARMQYISHGESNSKRHCRNPRPVRHRHAGSDATGSRTIPPRSQQPQDAEHESLLLEIAKINLESARENREAKRYGREASQDNAKAARYGREASRDDMKAARYGREASRDNAKAARYRRQADRVRLWVSCLYLAASVLAVALALGQAQPLAIADSAPQPTSPPAVVPEQRIIEPDMPATAGRKER